MAEYISKEETVKKIGKALEVNDLMSLAEEVWTERNLEIVLNTMESVETVDVQHINPLVRVEERVPNVSGNYLCYLSNGKFEVLYFDREIEDDEYNDNYSFGVWNTYPSDDGGECREWIEVLEVTHWMPLPESPKKGDIDG
jgi:hypothetical protein